MNKNEKSNNQSEDVKVSLGTAVFIVALTSIAFLTFVVWVSLKIKGLA